MRQLSLFSRSEISGMRDRTASRNYSAARDEFRREHERHREWGLKRRHAERLRQIRERAAASPAPDARPAGGTGLVENVGSGHAASLVEDAGSRQAASLVEDAGSGETASPAEGINSGRNTSPGQDIDAEQNIDPARSAGPAQDIAPAQSTGPVQNIAPARNAGPVQNAGSVEGANSAAQRSRAGCESGRVTSSGHAPTRDRMPERDRGSKPDVAVSDVAVPVAGVGRSVWVFARRSWREWVGRNLSRRAGWGDSNSIEPDWG